MCGCLSCTSFLQVIYLAAVHICQNNLVLFFVWCTTWCIVVCWYVTLGIWQCATSLPAMCNSYSTVYVCMDVWMDGYMCVCEVDGLMTKAVQTTVSIKGLSTVLKSKEKICYHDFFVRKSNDLSIALTGWILVDLMWGRSQVHN